MGGFFGSPSIPDPEPDPEVERLRREEAAKNKKLKEKAAERKKKLAMGMIGPRSLLSSGGYTGFPKRDDLGESVPV
tara:strand:+ start:998 stop:1225 length:228 start_codon:yes stop_codon:yes gene_type:complete